MKKNKIIAFASALVFMALIGYQLFGSSGFSTKKVIAATKNIAGNSVIGVEDLTLVDIPADSFREDMCVDAQQVIGQMSNSEIYAGETVSLNRLYAMGEDGKSVGGLNTLIEDGKRAITIEVGVPQGLCSMLYNGSMVDVVYVGSEGDSEVAKTFLHDVKVIALESNISNKKSGADAEVTTGSTSYSNVTLELSQKDAEKLALASSKGILWLTMRSSGDSEVEDTSAVSISDLV